MTTEIPVGKKHVALVDDEDAALVRAFPWYAHVKGASSVYARADISVEGKRIRLAMHRIILNVRPGLFTDHIDGDGLNNRRSNLRICTHQENARNRRKHKQSDRSPYKGVYAYGQTGKFISVIVDPTTHKQVTIGVFDEAEVAAVAYDEEARRLFGEFARPNFEVLP